MKTLPCETICCEVWHRLENSVLDIDTLLELLPLILLPWCDLEGDFLQLSFSYYYRVIIYLLQWTDFIFIRSWWKLLAMWLLQQVILTSGKMEQAMLLPSEVSWSIISCWTWKPLAFTSSKVVRSMYPASWLLDLSYTDEHTRQFC